MSHTSSVPFAWLFGTSALVLACGAGAQAQGAAAPVFQDSNAVTTPEPVAKRAGRSGDVAPQTAAPGTESIRVFGRRNPQAVARRKEFKALNTVNVQSAQEIAKYPDVSAAEALSRIPGVSLETDTGEGRFVNIRGVDADLLGYTFGGVPLPASSPASPFGGGRAVAFDAIPAGFIGQIEVTKTLRPEQDAQGIGGQIEITPKTVHAGDKPFVEGQLGTGLELLRNTPLAQGELTAGASFGLDRSPFADGYKPFSVLVTGEIYNDSRAVDDVEEAYADQQSMGVPDKVFSALELRRYTSYRRHRYGYGGEFAFEPNVDNRWYIRYSESGYSEQVNRQRLVFNLPDYLPDPGNKNGFLSTGATLSDTLRDEGEALRDRVFTVGGDNNFGGYTADYHFAWTRGTYDKGHDYNSTFNTGTVLVGYDNITDPSHPAVSVRQPGFNYLDARNYVLGSINNQGQHNSDTEWSGALNLSHPADAFGGDGVLKGGLSVRRRDRDVNQANNSYQGDSNNPILLSSLDAGSQIHTYYDNAYTLPPEPASGPVRGVIGGALAGSIAAQERDTEDVYATYFQYDWTHGPLSIMSGIRYERTEAQYGAYPTVVDRNGNPLPYVFRSSTRSYNDYFPSVQARYEITPSLIARLSYSTGIARPGFNQISAARSVDIGAETISGGNPSLVPQTADHFEGGLQYNTQAAGVASLEVFHIEEHNYIFARDFRSPDPAFPGIIFNNVSFANGGEGTDTGVELDLHQKLIYLPGWVSGFGIDVNYTFASTEGMVHPGIISVLPSTAAHTVNAAVFYEKYNVTARLAYDYVSQNLFAIGGSPATDIYSRARGTLDLSTQYQFADNFKVYANARNLLNTPLEFLEGGAQNRPIQREFYDVTLQTGIKFDF